MKRYGSAAFPVHGSRAAAVGPTITVYKSFDSIAIAVSHQILTNGCRAAAQGSKEIYVSVTTHKTAAGKAKHQPGDAHILMGTGRNNRELDLTAANIQALGMNPQRIIEAASELSASKVTLKTAQVRALRSPASHACETEIVAELGRFAVQLANRAAS